jgi:hypothetical protein
MTDDVNFRASMLEGVNKFQNARLRAFWQEMISHLRGKSTELLSFDDIRARLRLREESYRGLQNVPLDQIVGSVGRYRDFTGSFLPRTNKMQERWSRVYAQANSLTGLPPIELYKIGDVYFVRDGNHRVSVARQLGSDTIEAHVTELNTPIELKPGMTEAEIDDAAAYAIFLEESGLSRTRNHHQSMELTEKSRYADLLGHIYTHQALSSQVEKREVPLEEAAANWYDNIYRPAVTLIRKYEIMKHMSDRTEADLYLWLVDHLLEVREQYGEEAPSRKFSHALVDFLEDRNLSVPADLYREKDETLEMNRSYIEKAMEEARRREEEREAERARSTERARSHNDNHQ